MKKLFELFNLKQLSFLLIALPYLAFNSESIVKSPFFSTANLLLLFLGLFIIDIIIRLLLKQIGTRFYTTITVLTAYVIIVFFYGFYIELVSQNGISYVFNIFIRGRIILEFLTLLFIFITLLVRNKKVNLQYFNVFFITFFASAFISSLVSYKSNRRLDYKSNYTKIPTQDKSNKPVILIISDEYTSPDDLYKVYKDSSIYKFSNHLKNNGWIIKNSFYSYETSTIHSLSSLFNFNLSKDSKYSNEEINDIGVTKLLHASIADSLEKKKVNIINFGIFDIGKYPYLTRLYPYPTSFIEVILIQSLLYTFISNTGNLNESGLTMTYYPMESHNKYIIKHLTDTLNTITNINTFAYVHLYMPHGPIQYNPEFRIRTVNNLINYKDYWNFTNQKLFLLLKKIIRENKYRIILTGDHGYRGDKRINPHYTFTAFYGFDEGPINKIKSVQDLGSLINNGF
jgi:hypothetical protein